MPTKNKLKTAVALVKYDSQHFTGPEGQDSVFALLVWGTASATKAASVAAMKMESLENIILVLLELRSLLCPEEELTGCFL